MGRDVAHGKRQIGLGAGTRIYLRCGVTDLRKAFDGLTQIVEDDLARSITDGDFIVFCNRSKNRLKAIYWDGSGLCLFAKRLEGGASRRGVSVRVVTHPQYSSRQQDWPRSNPKGYGVWFEGRMVSAARSRRFQLVEERLNASVDEVPAYDWKTPLQRVVQILKRHRDVMFATAPDLKPRLTSASRLDLHGNCSLCSVDRPWIVLCRNSLGTSVAFWTRRRCRVRRGWRAVAGRCSHETGKSFLPSTFGRSAEFQ